MPPGTEPSSYFSLSETLHQDAERRHGRLKEPHSVLQHLSSKMALDCSACHQLYNMQQSDSKISQ
uniref:(California timema) hypothetical protein n=1 Tax=Timema californicum TaxID=61474 RepID=A0A7R9PCV3_TIMCA|nr:unnamed protein product [Timema californicum]